MKLKTEGYTQPVAFTGICDKNGREIYEGDVILEKYKDDDSGELFETEYEVFFSEDDGCFAVGNSYHKDKTLLESLASFRDFDIEVIGNVFAIKNENSN